MMRRNGGFDNLDVPEIMSIVVNEARTRFDPHIAQAIEAAAGSTLELAEALMFIHERWKIAEKATIMRLRDTGKFGIVDHVYKGLNPSDLEAASEGYSLWLIMRLIERCRGLYTEGRGEFTSWALEDLVRSEPTMNYVRRFRNITLSELPGEHVYLLSNVRPPASADAMNVPAVLRIAKAERAFYELDHTLSKGRRAFGDLTTNSRGVRAAELLGSSGKSLWVFLNGVPIECVSRLPGDLGYIRVPNYDGVQVEVEAGGGYPIRKIFRWGSEVYVPKKPLRFAITVPSTLKWVDAYSRFRTNVEAYSMLEEHKDSLELNVGPSLGEISGKRVNPYDLIRSFYARTEMLDTMMRDSIARLNA